MLPYEVCLRASLPSHLAFSSGVVQLLTSFAERNHYALYQRLPRAIVLYEFDQPCTLSGAGPYITLRFADRTEVWKAVRNTVERFSLPPDVRVHDNGISHYVRLGSAKELRVLDPKEKKGVARKLDSASSVLETVVS